MADKDAKWNFVCGGAQFIFHVHPHEHIAKRYWDAHKFVNIMCVVVYIAKLKSHIKDTKTAGSQNIISVFTMNTLFRRELRHFISGH